MRVELRAVDEIAEIDKTTREGGRIPLSDFAVERVLPRAHFCQGFVLGGVGFEASGADSVL